MVNLGQFEDALRENKIKYHFKKSEGKFSISFGFCNQVYLKGWSPVVCFMVNSSEKYPYQHCAHSRETFKI